MKNFDFDKWFKSIDWDKRWDEYFDRLEARLNPPLAARGSAQSTPQQASHDEWLSSPWAWECGNPGLPPKEPKYPVPPVLSSWYQKTVLEIENKSRAERDVTTSPLK